MAAAASLELDADPATRPGIGTGRQRPVHGRGDDLAQRQPAGGRSCSASPTRAWLSARFPDHAFERFSRADGARRRRRRARPRDRRHRRCPRARRSRCSRRIRGDARDPGCALSSLSPGFPTSRSRPTRRSSSRTTSDERTDEMTAIAVNRFAVRALPQDVATYVREQGRDPIWGHPALTEPATGIRAVSTLPAHVPGGRGPAHDVHPRHLRRRGRVPPTGTGLHPRRRLRPLRRGRLPPGRCAHSS